MKSLKKKSFLFCLFICIACWQKVQAQKETFFHHFNWNEGHYTSAASGSRGFSLNTLYRNYNDSLNYFFSTDIPIDKINSSFGFYYLHNSSAEQQTIQTGLSYTAFVNIGHRSSLRLGAQGNRHQKALCGNPWAFKEYENQTSFYTYDLSLFLRRDKLSLGISAENFFSRQSPPQTDYVVLLGFNELKTYDWLRSSPYMLARIRHNFEVPEWRFNYTATIANFLMVGGSYYKNSDYLYGFNAGFKLFNSIWLTAATDFVDTKLPYRAVYEFGLKINISKKDDRAAESGNPISPEEEFYEDDYEDF